MCTARTPICGACGYCASGAAPRPSGTGRAPGGPALRRRLAWSWRPEGGRCSIVLAFRRPVGDCSAARCAARGAPRYARVLWKASPRLPVRRGSPGRSTKAATSHRAAAQHGEARVASLAGAAFRNAPRVPRGGGSAPQPLPAAGAACGLGAVLRTLLGAPRGWLPPTCSRGLQGLRLDAWPRFAVTKPTASVARSSARPIACT